MDVNRGHGAGWVVAWVRKAMLAIIPTVLMMLLTTGFLQQAQRNRDDGGHSACGHVISACASSHLAQPLLTTVYQACPYRTRLVVAMTQDKCCSSRATVREERSTSLIGSFRTYNFAGANTVREPEGMLRSRKEQRISKSGCQP